MMGYVLLKYNLKAIHNNQTFGFAFDPVLLKYNLKAIHNLF